MTKGRPPKFESVEELEGVNDGMVWMTEVKSVRTKDFEKEKDLLEYIELNIELFCKDVLEDSLVEYEVERQFVMMKRFQPRARRIDLYVRGEENEYLVELKNPTHPADNRAAIGQILDYGRELPEAKLVLVTTMFDWDTAKTIEYYDLPIKYVYLDKKRSLKYLKNSEKL